MALAQLRNPARIDVKPDHGHAASRERGSNRQPDVAKPNHGNPAPVRQTLLPCTRDH
jgi:hypothetical protein